MSELFPIESVTKLTPRAAWMKKNGLKTDQNPNWEDQEVENGPWFCCLKNGRSYRDSDFGFGETEHDALADRAIKNKVRLWNEEGK